MSAVIAIDPIRVEFDGTVRSGNRGGFSFPNDFSPVGETLDAASETLGRATGGAVGTSSLEAVYTVPSNSTLMGSIAMTALMGRSRP